MKNLNRWSFTGIVKKVRKLQDVPLLNEITVEINGLTIKAMWNKKISFEIGDYLFVESKPTDKAFVVAATRIYTL